MLVKVLACGVCHTELDEIEGRTPPPNLPVVPGHQVVGTVVAVPESSEGDNPRRKLGTVPQSAQRAGQSPFSRRDLGQFPRFRVGDRVGVAWIFSACGRCEYCRSGQENLCPDFKATGRDADGGYAEYMTVPEAFAYPIPSAFTDVEAAPLLCAGAVGYRSLRLAGWGLGHNPESQKGTVPGARSAAIRYSPHDSGHAPRSTLGLTGFGASGHLVLKMVRHQSPKTHVYVFARSMEEQAFARELGAMWAGDTNDRAPELLDAVIDTTPVWGPVVAALASLKPGGRLVINAIRKEEVDKQVLLGLDYAKHLWMEKEIKSVANVTRRDVAEFLELAARIPIRPEVQEYRLDEANQALLELKQRKIRGAKVIRI